MSDRKTIIAVTTPYSGAAFVVCYEDTLTNKIIPANRVPGDPTPYIVSALENPTAVCVGTTNPDYLAFVNQSEVSFGRQHPFVVFVNPTGPQGVVASIGYRRDFKDLGPHNVLWRKDET